MPADDSTDRRPFVFRCTNAVSAHPTLPTKLRHMILTYALHANSKTGVGFTGQEKMAGYLGISVKTLQRQLKQLDELGDAVPVRIERKARFKARRQGRTSDSYRLVLMPEQGDSSVALVEGEQGDSSVALVEGEQGDSSVALVGGLKRQSRPETGDQSDNGVAVSAESDFGEVRTTETEEEETAESADAAAEGGAPREEEQSPSPPPAPWVPPVIQLPAEWQPPEGADPANVAGFRKAFAEPMQVMPRHYAGEKPEPAPTGYTSVHWDRTFKVWRPWSPVPCAFLRWHPDGDGVPYTVTPAASETKAHEPGACAPHDPVSAYDALSQGLMRF
jgi:hypothetical protein